MRVRPLPQSMLALCLATSLILLSTAPARGADKPGNNPVHGAHQDIVSEMEEMEPEILPHVDLLWRHTLQRSPTLQLALQKMAEKTGQVKVKDRSAWTGQMLQGLVQLGGIGGAVMTGSPAPLIGSAVLGRMTAPDTVPAQLTQVTSADLVILTREIEEAQSHLITSYLQYRQALAEQDKIREDLTELKNQSRRIPQDSSQAIDTLNTLLANQALKLQQAQHTVQTYRNLLVLTAGEEGVAEIDKLVNNKSHKSQPDPNHETQPPDKTPQG